jgi:hypothetical protein
MSEFADFCSGEKDPLLDFIREETSVPTSSRRLRYENTYRTEPERLFPHCRAQKLISQVLHKVLENVTYDGEKCRELAMELSGRIKNLMKEFDAPRYKLVSLVHIGEKDEQGIMMCSRCIWNAEHDCFASANFTNRTLFAVATVYACYIE